MKKDLIWILKWLAVQWSIETFGKNGEYVLHGFIQSLSTNQKAKIELTFLQSIFL